MSESNKPLKIFFDCLGGAGRQNACIGIGQALAKRGHRIFFLISKLNEGQFEKFGFKEMTLVTEELKSFKNTKESMKVHPMKYVAEKLLTMKEQGILSSLSPLEKVKFNENEAKTYSLIYKYIKEIQSQVKEHIDREQPDLIIVENYLISPSIVQSQVPWASLFTSNPTVLFLSDDLPPVWSGLPINNRNGWEEHRNAFAFYQLSLIRKYQNLLNREFGLPEIEPLTNFRQSKFMNIYGFPKELDYADIISVPKNFVRFDTFCREVTESFELPEKFKTNTKSNDKIIYLSMGSVVPIDVDLMKSLVEEFSQTPHKYIVSKGALAEEYELAENMWGLAYLPQTKVLPLVDLVVTHGGNNTVTEALRFGKPMLVLPFFHDQYDNAQRIAETGYGLRADPNCFQRGELAQAIDKILNDDALLERSRKAGKRIEQSQNEQEACQKIESLLRDC